MRITAGTHRSRNLKTLSSDHTRPTSDKIRQALFSKVGPYFQGGRFLDVFSGTGAMGLESLSRGMDEVVAFENNNQAARLILENVKALKETDHFKLLKGDAKELLKQDLGKFDLVFIDPPYDYNDFEGIINLVVEHCVHEDSIIIVESDHTKQLADGFGDFHCVQAKKYGQTMVRYFEVIHES